MSPDELATWLSEYEGAPPEERLFPGDRLAHAKSAQIITAPSSTLMSYPEAAYLLGVSSPALRKRVSDGLIPTRCIRRTGRRVQFIRTALIAWAEGNRP
jgi:excisionase family DNA binding protein